MQTGVRNIILSHRKGFTVRRVFSSVNHEYFLEVYSSKLVRKRGGL